MLKTIKQPNKKTSSIEQSEFTQKWTEIEKKQKRNKKFEDKIANFYLKFQSEILPEEEMLCEMIAKETRHLIKFIPRKSFTEWQREELHTWIELNLDTLTGHPFCPEPLRTIVREEYSQALLDKRIVFDDDQEFSADEIAGMRDLAEDILGDEKQFTEQELSDFLRDPATFYEYAADFLKTKQSDHDESFDDEFNDDFFDEFEEDFINGERFRDANQSKQEKTKKLKDLFNASQLKKCYKMLASRLHPDKELDPALKEQKSELMAQLVQAKKEKDAFTIISMFQQYIPDNDLNLDDDLNTELVALLTEKLSQLDQAHREMKNSNSIESMVWSRLGGRSKKVMETKKQEHLSALLAEQSAMQQMMDTTKTMKSLNQVLSERYEQRHRNPFNNMKTLQDLLNESFDIFE